MSDRISKTVLLCEDDGHAILVRSYWKFCEQSKTSAPIEVRNASRIVAGGNIGWVLEQFSAQIKACRQRHARANTLLIVVADADEYSVTTRTQHLHEKESFTDDDPLVLLVPKRHIETWIRAALGQNVTEEADCKGNDLKRTEIREAARQIYEWARHEPPADSTCVESLRLALPGWRKIG